MTMPGKATRRMLQRSIIQPSSGTISAEHTPPIPNASETVPRWAPISAIIGFRKTPKVNDITGPLQTNKPVTAPTTTHQGLVKRIPTASSLSALRATCARFPAILTRRASGGDGQLGNTSPLIRMLLSGSIGGGQLPAPFEQVRLLLEILGHAQPRFPDRWVPSLFRELAIPRRQFPQLLWVFHCRPKPPGRPSENAENAAAFPPGSDKHFVRTVVASRPAGVVYGAASRVLAARRDPAMRGC